MENAPITNVNVNKQNASFWLALEEFNFAICQGGLAEVGRICNYLIDRRNKKLGIDCSNVDLCKT